MEWSPQTQIDRFFTDGFAVFDGKRYDDILAPFIDNNLWAYEGGESNDYHPVLDVHMLDVAMTTVHYRLSVDIISHMFEEFTVEKRRVWEGVNHAASQWHNDYREGPNCFFLLYHSNMNNDGEVQFKAKNHEWTIYPYRGLLVLVNCENNFLHRASPSKQQRIISSFYFNIQHHHEYV